VSLRNTLRALPAIGRVSVLGAIAYRAEMVVWMLSTTLPFIMLALFSAVAREAPIGRHDERSFTLYFLVTFVVRQLTGAWSAWVINQEIKDGTLTARLLRPVSPVVTYAVENLAAQPLRLALSLPVVGLAIAWVGADQLPSDPLLWGAFAVALAGGWAISFLVQIIIGALGFFMESSVSVINLWTVLFFILSGYTIPVDLFPAWLRTAGAWLPFRYQIGLPVEILCGAHGRAESLALLLAQAGQVGALGLLAWAVWRRGIGRFEAFGG
jgi:ABC-2 type transport system permease protein